MIALIAAVALETELLRPALEPAAESESGPFDFFRGTVAGHPVVLLHCGVGKANAAAGTAVLLGRTRPAMVVNLGCGGAYPGSGLEVGDIALASEEIHGDEGVDTPGGFLDMAALDLPLAVSGGRRFFNRLPVDGAALARARRALGATLESGGARLGVGPFVTVSTGSGTDFRAAALARRWAGVCENMEGAAIAQVCLRYAVPFLEVRGISNPTGNRDMQRWDLKRGAEAAQVACRDILSLWPRAQEPT